MSRPQIKDTIKVDKWTDLPIGTYGEAMQLTETLEGWRNVRPVITHEKCIGCQLCYLLCPEGVIYEDEMQMVIDYDFCKGCGICAKECPKKCIQMEEESYGKS